MISLVAFFTLMTILFICIRKAIPIIIFSILDFGVFYILGWDFQSRGVIGSGKYEFSLAYYLFMIALIIILAAAIWLLFIKIRNKKAKINNLQ